VPVGPKRGKRESLKQKRKKKKGMTRVLIKCRRRKKGEGGGRGKRLFSTSVIARLEGGKDYRRRHPMCPHPNTGGGKRSSRRKKRKIVSCPPRLC